MNNYLLILLRTFSIFIILMIIIRLLGKREVGELSIFDLAVILIIADIAAMGIDDKDLFLPAILCLVLLLFLQKGFSLLLLKWSKLRSIIDGDSRVLIYKGQILYENLKKEAYTIDDLITQIHQEGLLDIAEVNLAILETSGTLAVFSKKRYDDVFLPVIISGKLEIENINLLKLDKSKILKIVSNKGLKLKQIAYFSMSDTKEGSLFLFK